jgi:hypothetical protein
MLFKHKPFEDINQTHEMHEHKQWNQQMHRRKNKIQLVKLMKGKTNGNKRSKMVEKIKDRNTRSEKV